MQIEIKKKVFVLIIFNKCLFQKLKNFKISNLRVYCKIFEMKIAYIEEPLFASNLGRSVFYKTEPIKPQKSIQVCMAKNISI